MKRVMSIYLARDFRLKAKKSFDENVRYAEWKLRKSYSRTPPEAVRR